MLFALLAAATPWISMSAGPVLLHQGGRPGVGSGPLVRLEAGVPLHERVAVELWLSGAVESAPLGAPGDRALVGAGAGARLLLARLDADGKAGLWAHVGAGYGALAAGEGAAGPAGFAGALLTFEPFLKRFQLGIEADAVAYRSVLGLAVLPSLRCAF